MADLIHMDTLARLVHASAKSKGFYDGSDVHDIHHVLSKHALILSEVGEMVEAVRKPGPSEKTPNFSKEEEEWADAMIRLLDYAAWRNLRGYAAILAKIEYNAGRPHMHGKLA